MFSCSSEFVILIIVFVSCLHQDIEQDFVWKYNLILILNVSKTDVVEHFATDGRVLKGLFPA